MPKKKGFTSERYQKEILKLVVKHKFMSTNEICKKLNMGFETAIKHLNELGEGKKIKLRKIGNRKFWYIFINF